MKINKLLNILLFTALLFTASSCEDEIPEEILSYYDLTITPESHTFPTEGGEVEFEITSTKTSVFYQGNSKTGSEEENAPYTVTLSGEGFTLDGNKVIAEENVGLQRFGMLIVTIDGTDTEQIIELMQTEAEIVDPTDGAIVSFTLKDVDADIQVISYSVFVTVADDVDITSLTPVIELSEDTEFVDFIANQPVDFTDPVEIKVMGTNQMVHTYTVTVSHANSPKGFSQVNEKFTISQENMPEPFNRANQLISMAVSRDQLVLKTGNVEGGNNIFGYNALTGTYENSAGTHHGINRLGTDSKGVILGTNNAAPGGTMNLFKLETLTSARETFFTTPYSTGTGTWGSGAAVNVFGDITQNAVIFAPVARNGQQPATYRIVIENGVIPSSAPELIEYGSYADEPRYNPFGNIGFAVPAGPRVEDGYIFGDREEFAYFKGDKKYIFRDEDTGIWTYGGPGGGKIFDMNGKKYFAVWRSISDNYGLFNILDITNPEAITMTEAQREAASIDFVVYESGQFDTVLGKNSSFFGNIDVKYLENGNVMLYFMFGNAGVKAYELVKNQ